MHAQHTENISSGLTQRVTKTKQKHNKTEKNFNQFQNSHCLFLYLKWLHVFHIFYTKKQFCILFNAIKRNLTVTISSK